MMNRFSAVILIAGLFTISLNAHGVRIEAFATGGGNLALNTQEITDGFGGDFTAEVWDNTSVPGDSDQGYAYSSITPLGVDLRSRSSAPDVYANSTAKISDSFTLETISGLQGQLLNAVMGFNLNGTIQLVATTSATSRLYVDIFARHDGFGQPFLDRKHIYYIVERNSVSGQVVGYNDNANWENLYQLNATPIANGFSFNVPLSLNLTAVRADEPIKVDILLSTNAAYGTADFSNSLLTDPDQALAITSGPAGSSYRVMTDEDYAVYGVGLFSADLDGEVIAPIPVPPALPLLLSGLFAIAMKSRKNKR